MGDYRNELQGALSQVEALRAENAALKLRLRALSDGRGDAAQDFGEPPPPVVTGAVSRKPVPRGLVVAAMGLVVVGAFGMVVGLRARRTHRAEPDVMMLPNAPTVPVESAPGALPMPPTRVTLPERRAPGDVVQEVDERGHVIEPLTVAESPRNALYALHARGNMGLLVLTTAPEAECTAGGVMFRTPRPVYLEPGVYEVRCRAGNVAHTWNARIETGRITVDLEHRIGR